jgi:hypothetical protein
LVSQEGLTSLELGCPVSGKKVMPRELEGDKGTDAFKRQSHRTSDRIVLCIRTNIVSVVGIACDSAI